MAERLNDTDPQSPAAINGRTDPGIGSPPILVVGPKDPLPEETAPAGPDEIAQLLDGITGPRPPPSSRRASPAQSARAYAAARPAPASQPMPAAEPLVLSPEPAPVGERDALTVPRALDAGSVRPLVRRPEERTVFTGRRAIVRNVVSVVASSAIFAAAMMGLMRWREQHAPPAAGAPVVVAPLTPSPEVPATSASIVILSPPPADPPAVTTTPAALPAASASAAIRTAVPRRGRMPRSAAPAGSLDDLNREISH